MQRYSPDAENVFSYAVKYTQRVVWEKPPRPQHIGLVLGGGAARSIAHIGVLDVLAQENIRPDYVAGTSAGALVGGLYAAGLSVEQLIELAHNVKWNTISGSPAHFSWAAITGAARPLGFLDLERLAEWIGECVGSDDLCFADLVVPFAALATDIRTGETIVLNDGPVGPAIQASCSIPGIFTPVEWGDRLLVDGGSTNNLPVSIAKQMGADYVIAVDLLPFGSDGPEDPRTIFDVGISSLYTMIRAAQDELDMADCLIQPLVGGVSFSALADVDALLDAGRAATELILPQIKRTLGMNE